LVKKGDAAYNQNFICQIVY